MGAAKIKTPKKSIHKYARIRKWLLRILAGVVLFGLAVFVWFSLSPWPGAMIIRWEFEQDGAKVTQALEKHAPTSGVTVISNQQYKVDDEDAMLDVYLPSDSQANEKLPVIIWTHGGAWLSGDKTNAAAYFKLLAKQGFTVVAPDYSLAPQKTYPTAVHQLNAAYAYLQGNASRFNADVNKIILAGDSAGSQLSAQMAAITTNPAYAQELKVKPTLKPEQLKGVVLNCGIYKMEELARPGPDLPTLIIWGDHVTVWAYSGTQNFSDPVIKQMSPYYHVTKDFPPTFITGGNADPLTNAQSKPFADELQSLGVNVTRLFYDANHMPALPHEYQFNLDNTDGQNALEQIVAFARMRTQ